MGKFKCKECSKELDLDNYTIKVVSGLVVSEEAKCCDTYMESIRENKGVGGIIKRPGGTVSKKF